MSEAALAAFEARLGHAFRDHALLRRALTHSSAAGERPGPLGTNERLEFLGDRVLGLCMAEILLARFPGENEGHLGRRFSLLVSRDTLAPIARELGIPAVLRVPPSQRHQNLKDNVTALADALEAVLAAVYLEAGLDAVRALVAREWEGAIAANARPPRPAKSRLQEWTLQRGLGLPSYECTSVGGMGDDSMFECTVTAAGRSATGRGPNKRAAELAAAEAWLAELGK
ncbi:MAG: ribonuclease III [Acetobacteraceae bacterium]|nr:ribonuclease III [Acetobacteraceae bacterium]